VFKEYFLAEVFPIISATQLIPAYSKSVPNEHADVKTVQ
jgi:hypothetical protein